MLLCLVLASEHLILLPQHLVVFLHILHDSVMLLDQPVGGLVVISFDLARGELIGNVCLRSLFLEW